MKKQFALTLDLGERLEEFRRVGIDTPGPHDEYITDIQAEIGRIVNRSLPEDYDVSPIHVGDLADDIIGKASQLPAVRHGATILSTCPEIAYPTRGMEIDINRLISFDGKNLGLGPRPGRELVKDQMRLVHAKTHRSGVVLVEDGVFSGATVRHVIDRLEQSRIPIRGVAVGLDCSETFAGEMEARGYDFFVTKQGTHYVDWVPDHDFIPFIPGSGRVLGVHLNDEEGAIPLYDHRESTSYTVPYIEPFGPIDDWASIEKTKAQQASVALLGLAIDLFLTLERRNADIDLRIGDLLRTKQTRLRTSLPARLNKPHFPPLDSKVSKYLSEMM
ncbi:hypothetical protein KC973_02340 [Candidatus Saccharibacteria bacterium]|nr:hypothetical protein [Candidatus Saccharibacteria bacterium]